MKLITGDYNKVKCRCEQIFPSGFFDFNFLYVSEMERFREIDRFLYESRHTLRFKNEYIGNVVIDISEWNHNCLNTYFESFMYFLKDSLQKYNCVLIISERCTKELFEKLKTFFAEIEEIQLVSSNETTKKRIGFISDIKEENTNVRG